MYLMICTSPDIAFPVERLSQHMQTLTEQLSICVGRVLHYIQVTESLVIIFSNNSKEAPVPLGYRDTDWAGCNIDRRSTSGYLFCVAGGAVSWRS